MDDFNRKAEPIQYRPKKNHPKEKIQLRKKIVFKLLYLKTNITPNKKNVIEKYKSFGVYDNVDIPPNAIHIKQFKKMDLFVINFR